MNEIINATLANIEKYLLRAKHNRNYYARIEAGEVGYVSRISSVDRTLFVEYRIRDNNRFVLEIHSGISVKPYYRPRMIDILHKKGIARRAYIDRNGELILFIDSFFCSALPMQMIEDIERNLISIIILHGEDLERIASGLEPIEEDEDEQYVRHLLRDIVESEDESDEDEQDFWLSPENVFQTEVLTKPESDEEKVEGDKNDEDVLNDLELFRDMIRIFKSQSTEERGDGNDERSDNG